MRKKINTYHYSNKHLSSLLMYVLAVADILVLEASFTLSAVVLDVNIPKKFYKRSIKSKITLESQLEKKH